MKTLMFLSIFAMISIDFSKTDWAKESYPHSFDTIQTSKDLQSIRWGRMINATKSTISDCTIQPLDCSNPGKEYKVDIIKQIDGTYKSVFTINNVTLDLHNSIWFITLDTETDGPNFNLSVFVPPENPLCDEVKLLNNSFVQVTCVTLKVFPKAICEFSMKTYNNVNKSTQEAQIPVSIRPTNYAQNASTTDRYIRTECTYTLSAGILGNGSYVFYVVMYANITSNITEDMKRQSPDTVPIVIGYPKAALASDCQVNNYIKENETRTCTCYNNRTGFLPTYVMWSVDGSINGTLNYTARRPSLFDQQDLICIISNPLNWTDQVKYQPAVAYPPDIVNLTLLNPVLDICEEKKVNILGTCFVSKSYPEPAVYVNINNLLIDLKSVVNASAYIYNVTLNSTGIFNISCNAFNKAFLKVYSSISKNGVIKGPPEIPKLFKLVNEVMIPPTENVLPVTKEETILCQSTGGYPNLKNLTLSCEENEIITKNYSAYHDTITLKLNITSSMTLNNVMCTCIVWHELKCVRNETTIRLKFSEIISEPIPDFKHIYIGVGVVTGFVIICIAVILILSNIRLGLIKKSSSGMYEKFVNNGALYFIKQESSSDINYPEYTNVATTMISAAEEPKNFNNKK